MAKAREESDAKLHETVKALNDKNEELRVSLEDQLDQKEGEMA